MIASKLDRVTLAVDCAALAVVESALALHLHGCPASETPPGLVWLVVGAGCPSPVMELPSSLAYAIPEDEASLTERAYAVARVAGGVAVKLLQARGA